MVIQIRRGLQAKVDQIAGAQRNEDVFVLQ